jgi:hypothetical protein
MRRPEQLVGLPVSELLKCSADELIALNRFERDQRKKLKAANPGNKANAHYRNAYHAAHALAMRHAGRQDGYSDGCAHARGDTPLSELNARGISSSAPPGSTFAKRFPHLVTENARVPQATAAPQPRRRDFPPNHHNGVGTAFLRRLGVHVD